LKTDTQDINKQQLTRAINVAYGLDLSSLTFVPKGEDAYAYVGQASDGARYFIRAQAARRAGPLESVYAITHALHTQFGLRAVVAPLPTRQGTYILNHGSYVVAVFSFFQGRTLYDQDASDADLAQAASIVAALHSSGAAQDMPSLQRESFANPFEAPIRQALQAIDAPTPRSNTYQRRLLQLLAAERADLLATLEKMRRLGARARGLTTDWVLTHGDPNLDNLLKDERGQLHLTDWGEVALGPPERDLFAFTGAGFEAFLWPYVRARKQVRLHPEVFAFYAYRWTVQEIADYTTRILFHSLGEVEDEHAWEELQPYLPVRHRHIALGVQALRTVLERVEMKKESSE
jgi:aminoglycoside phosphotransferase (APT) family kinase protein